MMKHPQTRRDALKVAAALTAVAWTGGCTAIGSAKRPSGRVVVIGAGFGGASAAKYIHMWSGGRIDVTLVEANRQFVSCPMSNLVLGGHRNLDELTASYAGLQRRGIRMVHDRVVAIDAQKKQLRLASGASLAYDRLVVSPGIELMHEAIAGMDARAQETILHAWKAGEQTVALRQQLVAMPAGGVVLMSIPRAPYRCPPGPYERACQIASYLKAHKPGSKLIVLDANGQITSKPTLFGQVFEDDYQSIIEYHPDMQVTQVDAPGKRFVTELGDSVSGDVLNLIAPQRAGAIARAAGLITANERWCGVDWRSMESVAVPFVHVLGDATLSAPKMPKSGHMANQHGKVAAAAIVELMSGRAPIAPMMTNTCYSYVDGQSAMHVSSVHRWDEQEKTMIPVDGAGGISKLDRSVWLQEGHYAWGWAQTVWADMLT